ncbi:hypothetical protein [Aquabacterium sp.]|uniref:hypothetical protein n=1 Tax=Aquabacterium sp. TaxID=1872578 RepID=UPI002B824A9B|nr:hypothetical protein [Aquabacterium sp.]HSW06118.1 hypothetical protein [Aquabacterium sp.]
MGVIDAFWHLLNLLAPAIGMGMIAAAAAKLLWHRELKAVRWRRLALWSSAACAVVLIAGLVITGRDGRMGTYAAMVPACAAALWWAGFRSGGR